MWNRYRRSPLVIIAFLCAVAGGAEHALALTFTEFQAATNGALPGSIAAGPDGALWFTETATPVNKIGRITTEGVATDFPIPTSNTPARGIVAGAGPGPWGTQNQTRRTDAATHGTATS